MRTSKKRKCPGKLFLMLIALTLGISAAAYAKDTGQVTETDFKLMVSSSSFSKVTETKSNLDLAHYVDIGQKFTQAGAYKHVPFSYNYKEVAASTVKMDTGLQKTYQIGGAYKESNLDLAHYVDIGQQFKGAYKESSGMQVRGGQHPVGRRGSSTSS